MVVGVRVGDTIAAPAPAAFMTNYVDDGGVVLKLANDLPNSVRQIVSRKKILNPVAIIPPLKDKEELTNRCCAYLCF